MRHYSCDRCKRVLDPQEDLRYVVRLEVQAVMEPINDCELTDDRDHLLEIEEILERADDEECDAIAPEVYQKKSFDLCCDCHRKFMQNPLGRESKVSLDFSQN
ncbi:hypothetical protein [Anatilimnocola floriformis]|uniref:hypothetical protein n=1 Tax=Anatilimnocola floriformis TaxID=2948575 RepID=UPI0020C30805|nr:hypothetical protein [Anatilimnocola floriformis]